MTGGGLRKTASVRQSRSGSVISSTSAGVHVVLEVLRDGLGHRLAVPGGALLRDLICPQDPVRSLVDQLHRDVAAVFNSGAVCKQAPRDFRSSRFAVGLDSARNQNVLRKRRIGNQLHRNLLLLERCRNADLEAIGGRDVNSRSSHGSRRRKSGEAKRKRKERDE